MIARRVAFAGIFIVAAGPALAQGAAIPFEVQPQPAERVPNQELRDNGVTPQQQQRLQMRGAPQDTGLTPQGGERRSAIDALYIRDTLGAGTVSLQQSTFARTKAQDPRVKRFAEFEEARQIEIRDLLRSIAEPDTTASAGAERAASTAPVLSSEAGDIMERFSRARPGPEFDREYVAAQIHVHEDLLRVQERFLEQRSTRGDLTAIARLARSHAREHLAMLQELQRELGR